MGATFLTDSGLETWLVFHREVELDDFAAFPLLDSTDGRTLLLEYYRDHLRVAQRARAGLVLETPTWRASADWGARLGYDAAALDRVNRDSVRFVREVAAEADGLEVVVSGNIGPRGDGYKPSELLDADAAEAYHRAQITSFAAADVDRVTMLTATHPGEAIGVVRAAAEADLPVVISFTVETDGRLPDGQELHEAIGQVDAATDGGPLHYGVNCAHPDHFSDALRAPSPAVERIALLRANASRASHADLDEAEELDEGDPTELASLYAGLRRSHPHLSVLGGCCGTDVRHVEAIAAACLTGN